MTYTTDRRIYVACLASYNEGILHGVWIDVDGMDADDIQAEVDKLLLSSKFPNVRVTCPVCDGDPGDVYCGTCDGDGEVPSAEEWAIHDHEGFGGLVDEGTDFETIAEWSRLLGEHGQAYVAYMDHIGAHYATESHFEESYCGEYDSEQAYAENYLDEAYNLDDMMGDLACYFDYDKFAHDMFLDGHRSMPTATHGVYVFRDC